MNRKLISSFKSRKEVGIRSICIEVFPNTYEVDVLQSYRLFTYEFITSIHTYIHIYVTDTYTCINGGYML